MTDLEREMIRQIHELAKEVTELRERVVRLEIKSIPNPYTVAPQPSPLDWYKITCSTSELCSSCGGLPHPNFPCQEATALRGGQHEW